MTGVTGPDGDGDEQSLAPLPTHQDEIMTAHEGRPTVAEQDRTHGAGIPPVARGQ